MIKTVIAVFDNFDEAQNVVRDLKDEGFMESDISIVANNATGSDPGSLSTRSDRGNLDPSLTGDTARELDVMGSGMDASTTGATSVGSLRADGSQVRDMRTGELAADDKPTGDATGAATGAVAGGVLGGAAGVAVSLMGLAIPGIGPIIAAGPIVAGLTGAGVGAVAGGLIGGLTSLGVPKEHAEYYAESVRRGGALVTIRCDEARAERAEKIMQDHGAVDIEARVERWRDTGWKGYDGESQPLNADQVASERSTHASSTGTARSSRSRASADWNSVESDFRREHELQYAGQAQSFDDYAPAYRYGYETAGKDTYRGRNWDEVESDVRGDWERSNPGNAWEEFKTAVKRGWERMTGDTSSTDYSDDVRSSRPVDLNRG